MFLKRHPYWTSTAVLFLLLVIFTILLKTTQQERLGWNPQGVIGIVKLQGAILNPDSVVAQIKKMQNTESILGVVVRLNSPGGGVAASQEIYDALKGLQATKPVYSSMGSVAASGAYYVACATERIFANPGTITGSIGVLLQWFNFQELASKMGVQTLVIKSVQNKDLMSMFQGLDEQERLILQQLVDDTHEQFVQVIVQGRKNLEESQIRRLADGRVLVGERAKAVGLVDELGSFSHVVQALGEELNLQEPIRTVEFQPTDFSLESLIELTGLKKILPTPSGLRLSYLLE